MPAWKRPKVLRQVAQYYATLAIGGIEFSHVAAVSREEDALICQMRGWDVVRVPNEPLNEKHNAAALLMRAKPVDAVMHLNSDDFITRPYFKWVRRYLLEGAESIRFRDQVYYDVDTGRMAHCSPALPGSGTVLSRSLMKRLGWKPWQGAPIDRFLDTRLFQRIREVQPNDAKMIGFRPGDPEQLLGLKTEVSMWSFDRITSKIRHLDPIDPVEYLSRHFESDLNPSTNPLFSHAHQPD